VSSKGSVDGRRARAKANGNRVNCCFRIGRDLIDGGLAAGPARAEDYNINRYQQPKDEFDPKWTFEGTAQETAVAVRVGAEIANSSRWPAWKQGAEFLGIRAGSDEKRR